MAECDCVSKTTLEHFTLAESESNILGHCGLPPHTRAILKFDWTVGREDDALFIQVETKDQPLFRQVYPLPIFALIRECKDSPHLTEQPTAEEKEAWSRAMVETDMDDKHAQCALSYWTNVSPSMLQKIEKAGFSLLEVYLLMNQFKPLHSNKCLWIDKAKKARHVQLARFKKEFSVLIDYWTKLSEHVLLPHYFPQFRVLYVESISPLNQSAEEASFNHSIVTWSDLINEYRMEDYNTSRASDLSRLSEPEEHLDAQRADAVLVPEDDTFIRLRHVLASCTNVRHPAFGREISQTLLDRSASVEPVYEFLHVLQWRVVHTTSLPRPVHGSVPLSLLSSFSAVSRSSLDSTLSMDSVLETASSTMIHSVEQAPFWFTQGGFLFWLKTKAFLPFRNLSMRQPTPEQAQNKLLGFFEPVTAIVSEQDSKSKLYHTGPVFRDPEVTRHLSQHKDHAESKLTVQTEQIWIWIRCGTHFFLVLVKKNDRGVFQATSSHFVCPHCHAIRHVVHGHALYYGNMWLFLSTTRDRPDETARQNNGANKTDGNKTNKRRPDMPDLTLSKKAKTEKKKDQLTKEAVERLEKRKRQKEACYGFDYHTSHPLQLTSVISLLDLQNQFKHQETNTPSLSDSTHRLDTPIFDPKEIQTVMDILFQVCDDQVSVDPPLESLWNLFMPRFPFSSSSSSPSSSSSSSLPSSSSSSSLPSSSSSSSSSSSLPSSSSSSSSSSSLPSSSHSFSSLDHKNMNPIVPIKTLADPVEMWSILSEFFMYNVMEASLFIGIPRIQRLDLTDIKVAEHEEKKKKQPLAKTSRLNKQEKMRNVIVSNDQLSTALEFLTGLAFFRVVACFLLKKSREPNIRPKRLLLQTKHTHLSLAIWETMLLHLLDWPVLCVALACHLYQDFPTEFPFPLGVSFTSMDELTADILSTSFLLIDGSLAHLSPIVPMERIVCRFYMCQWFFNWATAKQATLWPWFQTCWSLYSPWKSLLPSLLSSSLGSSLSISSPCSSSLSISSGSSSTLSSSLSISSVSSFSFSGSLSSHIISSSLHSQCLNSSTVTKTEGDRRWIKEIMEGQTGQQLIQLLPSAIRECDWISRPLVQKEFDSLLERNPDLHLTPMKSQPQYEWTMFASKQTSKQWYNTLLEVLSRISIPTSMRHAVWTCWIQSLQFPLLTREFMNGKHNCMLSITAAERLYIWPDAVLPPDSKNGHAFGKRPNGHESKTEDMRGYSMQDTSSYHVQILGIFIQFGIVELLYTPSRDSAELMAIQFNSSRPMACVWACLSRSITADVVDMAVQAMCVLRPYQGSLYDPWFWMDARRDQRSHLRFTCWVNLIKEAVNTKQKATLFRVCLALLRGVESVLDSKEGTKCIGVPSCLSEKMSDPCSQKFWNFLTRSWFWAGDVARRCTMDDAANRMCAVHSWIVEPKIPIGFWLDLKADLETRLCYLSQTDEVINQNIKFIETAEAVTKTRAALDDVESEQLKMLRRLDCWRAQSKLVIHVAARSGLETHWASGFEWVAKLAIKSQIKTSRDWSLPFPDTTMDLEEDGNATFIPVAQLDKTMACSYTQPEVLRSWIFACFAEKSQCPDDTRFIHMNRAAEQHLAFHERRAVLSHHLDDAQCAILRGMLRREACATHRTWSFHPPCVPHIWASLVSCTRFDKSYRHGGTLIVVVGDTRLVWKDWFLTLTQSSPDVSMTCLWPEFPEDSKAGDSKGMVHGNFNPESETSISWKTVLFKTTLARPKSVRKKGSVSVTEQDNTSLIKSNIIRPHVYVIRLPVLHAIYNQSPNSAWYTKIWDRTWSRVIVTSVAGAHLSCVQALHSQYTWIVRTPSRQSAFIPRPPIDKISSSNVEDARSSSPVLSSSHHDSSGSASSPILVSSSPRSSPSRISIKENSNTEACEQMEIDQQEETNKKKDRDKEKAKTEKDEEKKDRDTEKAKTAIDEEKKDRDKEKATMETDEEKTDKRKETIDKEKTRVDEAEEEPSCVVNASVILFAHHARFQTVSLEHLDQVLTKVLCASCMPKRVCSLSDEFLTVAEPCWKTTLVPVKIANYEKQCVMDLNKAHKFLALIELVLAWNFLTIWEHMDSTLPIGSEATSVHFWKTVCRWKQDAIQMGFTSQECADWFLSRLMYHQLIDMSRDKNLDKDEKEEEEEKGKEKKKKTRKLQVWDAMLRERLKQKNLVQRLTSTHHLRALHRDLEIASTFGPSKVPGEPFTITWEPIHTSPAFRFSIFQPEEKPKRSATHYCQMPWMPSNEYLARAINESITRFQICLSDATYGNTWLTTKDLALFASEKCRHQQKMSLALIPNCAATEEARSIMSQIVWNIQTGVIKLNSFAIMKDICPNKLTSDKIKPYHRPFTPSTSSHASSKASPAPFLDSAMECMEELEHKRAIPSPRTNVHAFATKASKVTPSGTPGHNTHVPLYIPTKQDVLAEETKKAIAKAEATKEKNKEPKTVQVSKRTNGKTKTTRRPKGDVQAKQEWNKNKDVKEVFKFIYHTKWNWSFSNSTQGNLALVFPDITWEPDETIDMKAPLLVVLHDWEMTSDNRPHQKSLDLYKHIEQFLTRPCSHCDHPGKIIRARDEHILTSSTLNHRLVFWIDTDSVKMCATQLPVASVLRILIATDDKNKWTPGFLDTFIVLHTQWDATPNLYVYFLAP